MGKKPGTKLRPQDIKAKLDPSDPIMTHPELPLMVLNMTKKRTMMIMTKTTVTVVEVVMVEDMAAELHTKRVHTLIKIKGTQDQEILHRQAHLAPLLVLPPRILAVLLVVPMTHLPLQPRLDDGSGQMQLASGNGPRQVQLQSLKKPRRLRHRTCIPITTVTTTMKARKILDGSCYPMVLKSEPNLPGHL